MQPRQLCYSMPVAMAVDKVNIFLVHVFDITHLIPQFICYNLKCHAPAVIRDLCILLRYRSVTLKRCAQVIASARLSCSHASQLTS